MADRGAARLEGSGAAAAPIGPSPGPTLLPLFAHVDAVALGASALRPECTVAAGSGSGAGCPSDEGEALMVSTASLGIALAVIVLVAVALIGARLRRPSRREAWLRQENMPEDLRSAKLVASERSYRCEKPVALSGRPDQVYRLSDGMLVVVDTKRRQRSQVYAADIAQLSIYRVLLSAQKAFQPQTFAEHSRRRAVPADESVGYGADRGSAPPLLGAAGSAGEADRR
ncbi:MAG: hypothetical protein IAF00_13065 [Phycisphaerales bacterium]|nr:hypothetical protein [Phycisphaerales bacterium]